MRVQAIGPLAVPVATFILKGLATGVLSKIGGEAFGKVLSEVGFEDQGAKTLSLLKEVDAKLDQIKQSLSELNSKVDGLSTSLAFARLSNVRTSVRDLVGRRYHDARARLQQLSGGKITDPTLRREKRAELLEIIKTKLLTEQNTLNQAIDSTQGNDDIIHMAFLAERTKGGRFWSDENWRRAASIVTYYRDEAAQLLLLRVEYEYSSVKQDSTPLYISERKAIAQDMVDKQNEEFGRFNSAYPTLIGSSTTTVDTKPGPDGKYQVWVNDSRFDNYLFPLAESAPNQYQDKYPSLAEYRHLVSGRGSQSRRTTCAPKAFSFHSAAPGPVLGRPTHRRDRRPCSGPEISAAVDAAGPGASTTTARASWPGPAGTSGCATYTPGSTSGTAGLGQIHRLQRRPISYRPPMPERIGESSLAMSSPRGLMIGRILDIRCTGPGGTIDERPWFLNEDLDPRGRQADIRRTCLVRLAWDGLMHEEGGAVDMEPGDPAQIPENTGTKGRGVPTYGSGRVRDDQHHGKRWTVGVAGHR